MQALAKREMSLWIRRRAAKVRIDNPYERELVLDRIVDDALLRFYLDGKVEG
jgi:hypothetical protein